MDPRTISAAPRSAPAPLRRRAAIAGACIALIMATIVASPGATISLGASFDGSSGTTVNGTATYKDHPDLGGAVGRTQVVDCTGQGIVVRDKATGAVLRSLTMAQFWQNAGLAPTANNDPRMVYDPLVDRWYVVESAASSFLAVSAGPDATGPWKGVVLGTQAGDLLMRVGFDRNGVYVCEYQPSGSLATCFALPKADVLWSGSGGISLAHLATIGDLPFESFPAIDLDPAKPANAPEVLLTRQGTQNATSLPMVLVMTRIAWSGTTATASPAQNIATPLTYTTPGTAPQPDGVPPIRGVEDHRLFNVCARNGSVFTVTGSQVGARIGIEWFELRIADGALLQSGTIADPAWDALFPSLAVDANGGVGVGFTRCSASEYPSVYVTGRLAGDAAGTMRPPVRAVAGTASYRYQTRNPVGWGTYTTTALDPVDPTLIWTFQEYGASAVSGQWATRWVAFSLASGGGATDTTAPTVAITAPAANAIVSGATTIAATASDNVGVTRVDVLVDGAVIASDTAAPWQATWAPATAGAHLLQAKAYDAAGNVGASAVVAVTTPPAAQSPYGGSPRAIPGAIEAEDFDDGGEGVAYHDTDPANDGGGYRQTAVDIRACSDSGGGWQVGWMGAGEWLEYTLGVAGAGSYDLAVRVASGAAGATIRVAIDGVDRTGPMSFAGTGGWDSWQTIGASGLSLAAGPRLLRLSVDAGALDVNWLSLTPAGAGVVDGGWYELVARHSGKCLTVDSASAADGANVVQWADAGGAGQRWRIDATGLGDWRLTAACSGRCLAVADAGLGDGANVRQETWTGAAAQRWRIEDTGGGAYRLVAVHSGKVLDVSGISTADGANVHQWTDWNGDNQRWSLVPVAASAIGAASRAARDDRALASAWTLGDDAPAMLRIARAGGRP